MTTSGCGDLLKVSFNFKIAVIDLAGNDIVGVEPHPVFGCDLFTDEIARGGEIIVPRVVINMFGVLPGDFYSSIGGTGVGDEDFIRKLYGRC